MLKKFETMASGRILLAEILQRGETPLVVLYDTSQDDDVNINAACMKALQDKTLASPLQVREGFTRGYVCCDGSPLSALLFSGSNKTLKRVPR